MSLIDPVVGALREHMHLPDPSHVLFAAAVAVSSAADGDPLWGMLVGAPSSGKTEVVRALGAVADDAVDDITAAGLLSWQGTARKGQATGMLVRLGERGFATIGDFSTLLGSNDRGGRDQLYALLRRAYDGSVDRQHAHAPHPLHWAGRLTLLAAVTPRIDNFSSHSDALGPRWVYFRLPTTSTDEQRRAARKVRAASEGLPAWRRASSEAMHVAVRAARERLSAAALSDGAEDAIEDAALVACLGRAAVDRDAYGRKEIVGQPIIEEPMRLVGQLRQLARALTALGIEEGAVVRLTCRCALDSIPEERAGVLRALALGEPLSVSAVHRATRLNRNVARRALEDLQAAGVATYLGADEDTGDDASKFTPHPWHLTPEHAELVVAACDSARDPKCGSSTPLPPSNGGRPTVVVTPEGLPLATEQHG